MKATGMTRKIDDLGRIVVPKEIRRTLRIREGDTLEIYTEDEGEIILKKYSPIGDLTAFAKQYAEALAQNTGHIVSITDKENHIAVAGNGKRELSGQPISKELMELIQRRRPLIAGVGETHFIPLTPDAKNPFKYEVIYPILAEGDVGGAVILLSREEKVVMGIVEQKLAAAAANFLGKQIEM